MNKRIPIYIVDDEALVRDALSHRLQAEGYRTATFASGFEFLQVAAALMPGCLLVDVAMPEMDGLTLHRRLIEGHFRFTTIIMTARGNVAMAVEAMRAGAVDFLQKPFAGPELLAAVAEAVTSFENRSADRSYDDAVHKLEVLSTRERQVFEGLAAGKQNKVLAHDLGISPRTVEIHRARVLRKLEVRSIPGVIQIALDAGLIAPLRWHAERLSA
jgi:two-component system, LuxR family, response regulator FixJ